MAASHAFVAARIAEGLGYYGLEYQGVPLSDAAVDELATYTLLLDRVRTRFNLIGATSVERIIDELVLDSLQLLPLLPANGHFVDVGTGAGLPGVPLLIAMADWTGTFVEPRLKRAEFVRSALRKVARKRSTVVRGHLLETGLDTDEPVPSEYDLVVSKAVFPPDAWFRLATRLVREDGHMSVYLQGPSDESSNVLPTQLVRRIIADRTYTLRSGSTRSVILLRPAGPLLPLRKEP